MPGAASFSDRPLSSFSPGVVGPGLLPGLFWFVGKPPFSYPNRDVSPSSSAGQWQNL
jgi:hypothetical protein